MDIRSWGQVLEATGRSYLKLINFLVQRQILLPKLDDFVLDGWKFDHGFIGQLLILLRRVKEIFVLLCQLLKLLL